MARNIRVRTGTSEDPTGRKVPVAWVETAIRLEPEVHDLADGIGSKFLRYEIGHDEDGPGDRPRELPESMTQQEILKLYREEYSYWGEAAISLWGSEMGESRQKACMQWLTELVVAAFPEMREYAR